jgi:hypothetical protein
MNEARDGKFDERMSKLPELTALYWLIKITSTTLGETGGDLLSMTLRVGYALSTLLFMSTFLASVVGQLWVRRHIPWLYWTVIVTSSTAGTTMSDWMDRTLGLGYLRGTLILTCLLLGILGYWRFLTPYSLSVTHVRSRRIEVLYWIAILFSNTLGTALGDYLADDSGLGFAGVARPGLRYDRYVPGVDRSHLDLRGSCHSQRLLRTPEVPTEHRISRSVAGGCCSGHRRPGRLGEALRARVLNTPTVSTPVCPPPVSPPSVLLPLALVSSRLARAIQPG